MLNKTSLRFFDKMMTHEITKRLFADKKSK